MKLVCAPETFAFPDQADALHVVLYGAARTSRPWQRWGIGAL